jgi:hypothetical protein
MRKMQRPVLERSAESHFGTCGWLGAVGVLMLGSCQLLIDSDLGELSCEQEGVVGPPACRSGELCQDGKCVECQSRERCGDELDNDCDGEVDDACPASGGAGGSAGAAGGDGAAPE